MYVCRHVKNNYVNDVVVVLQAMEVVMILVGDMIDGSKVEITMMTMMVVVMMAMIVVSMPTIL